MYHYTVIQWLFFFYFYCFCGWCIESTYVSLKSRKLTNRGFLRGPFIPLYGSGAIMMLVVSMPFQDNFVMTYIAGCIGATVLEYVTGVAMEALFKVRYWDYSKNKFNFQGHVCLGTSLAWGLLTILMTEFVHKHVEHAVLLVPEQLLTVVTLVLTAGIFADLALSFKAAIDLRDILLKMEQAKEEMARIQKRLDVIIALTGEELGARKEAFVKNISAAKEELTKSLSSRRGSGAEEEPAMAVEAMSGEEPKTAAEAIFGEEPKPAAEAIFGEKPEGAAGVMSGEEPKPAAEAMSGEEPKTAVETMEGKDAGVDGRIERLKDMVQSGLIRIPESIKEELLELKTRYTVNRELRNRLSGLKNFSLRSLIRSNPGMTSVKFRESLEELKEKNAKRKER